MRAYRMRIGLWVLSSIFLYKPWSKRLEWPLKNTKTVSYINPCKEYGPWLMSVVKESSWLLCRPLKCVPRPKLQNKNYARPFGIKGAGFHAESRW